MTSVSHYSGLLKSMWEHPTNIKSGRFRAIGAFAQWQTQKRVFRAPIVAPVFESSQMVLYPDSHVAGNLLYYGGFRDVDEAAFVRAFLRPGDRVIDVGANEGVYALLFAECVGPRGQVLAVEPLPTNVDRLIANLGLNGYGQVSVVAAAAGEASGSIEFTLNRAPGGSSERVALPSDFGLETLIVPAVTLDEVAPDEGVMMIKLDVEGLEPLVLAGAERLLTAQRVPVILMEFVQKFLVRYGGDAYRTQRWLDERGYSLATFSAARNELNLEVEGVGTSHTNLFAVDIEQVDRIAARAGCSIRSGAS